MSDPLNVDWNKDMELDKNDGKLSFTKFLKIVDKIIDNYAPLTKLSKNKTSIQWTPGLKFISASTKEFWSKMIFEQQNQKKFPEKHFFSEKN